MLFALSSHTLAPDERWIERSLEHHADPRVAGCCGLRHMPDSSLLFDPISFDASRIREHPYWGSGEKASAALCCADAAEVLEEELLRVAVEQSCARDCLTSRRRMP